MIPNEKAHDLGTQRQSPCGTEMGNFGRFWVKEPRHSETISDQKWYHLYHVPLTTVTPLLLAASSFVPLFVYGMNPQRIGELRFGKKLA